MFCLTMYSPSWHLHRQGLGLIPREEPAGGTASRIRHRRVRLLQHERVQREPVCDHIRRVGSGQDGGCKAHHAIHSQCVWGKQLVYTRDKEYGAGYESFIGIVWQCQNFAE